MPELGVREAKALSLAAATAAAGVGMLVLHLGREIFQPWPAALLLLLLAGAAGGLSCWAAGGRTYGFPLSLLLLPFVRLVLLCLKHGPPPWFFDRRFLLQGDGFPWWAGASILASLYAGSLSACWARVTVSLEKIREMPPHDRPGAAMAARAAGEEAGRLHLAGFFLAAAVMSLAGVGREGGAVVFCLLVFFLAGITLTGLIRARVMTAVWHADGAAIAGESEARWLAGHWRWLLPPFFLLPLLPWLSRPLSLAGIWNFLTRISLRPEVMPEKNAIPGRLAQMPFLRLPGLWGRILLGCLLVLYTILLILAVFLAAVFCFLALRRLALLIRGWFAGLLPLLRVIRDFLAAMLGFFRRVIAPRSFRPFLPGVSRVRPEAGIRRHRAAWPPTPIRRLFTRLVLWGRAQGIPLPPVLAPAEIAARLSAVAPEGGDEDLAFLAEGYRRERYGEEKPDRRMRLLYRRAWERIVRNRGGTGPAAPKGGGT